MSLIRLAYASEATFAAKALEKGVEPHVARILMASRRNNGKAGLVGGLYYGDNRFFQYLEGEESAVQALYQRIQSDSRHRNIRTLIEEPIANRSFSNWSMKYVPVSTDVQAFLSRHDLTEFNPAAFDSQQCEEMIELIRRSSVDQKLVHFEEKGSEGTVQPTSGASGMKVGLMTVAACLVLALAAGIALY